MTIKEHPTIFFGKITLPWGHEILTAPDPTSFVLLQSRKKSVYPGDHIVEAIHVIDSDVLIHETPRNSEHPSAPLKKEEINSANLRRRGYFNLPISRIVWTPTKV